MKKLNRKEEAVSPVIATILMVAITVVLAATLYMMVGGFGEEGGGTPVAGDITQHDDTTFRFVSLSTPSSAELEDVEITVILADGTQEGPDTIAEVNWTVLSDGEVASGSRFDVSYFTDINWGDGDLIEEVIIRIDGYTGTIEWMAD